MTEETASARAPGFYVLVARQKSDGALVISEHVTKKDALTALNDPSLQRVKLYKGAREVEVKETVVF